MLGQQARIGEAVIPQRDRPTIDSNANRTRLATPALVGR